METVKLLIRKYSILTFLILTFAWSWLWWSLILINVKPGHLFEGSLPAGLYIIYFIGGFGPSLAGILLTFLTEGTAGLKELFSRLMQFRANILLYIGVIFVPVAIAAAIVYFEFILGKPLVIGQFVKMIVPGAIIGLLSGLMEEFGWRGFLQAKLQEKYRPMASSLIIGLFWGLWQFVITYASTGNFKGYFLICFLISGPVILAGYSVIMSCIYNNSQGSIFFAVMFHSLITGCSIVFFTKAQNPVELLYVLIFEAIAIWIMASIFLSIYGTEMESRARHIKLDFDIT